MLENLFENYIGVYMPEMSFLGNTLDAYAEAFLVFLFLWILFAIIYKILFVKAKKFAAKTENNLDDAVLEVFDAIRPQFYVFLALYIGVQTLVLHTTLDKTLEVTLYFWVAYYGIKALIRLTRVFVENRVEDEAGQATAEAGQEVLATTRFLTGLARFILWTLALLFILSNLGIEVTSLIAGLGIGGLAVAFALQNILADLFSSFAIYFDKPFAVGDFIQVGEHLGEVTKVGIKTTRVKSISGEELVFSNRELTSSRIQNYGMMEERRVQFSFGVTYNTPKEKLEKIVEMLKVLIDQIDQTRFDRAHFKDFGDSALNFEVVYFVLSSDYAEYMDIQQKINLGMVDLFKKEGIEFAFPTRTIYLEK